MKSMRELFRSGKRMGFNEPKLQREMGNQPITAIIGGKHCEFRSKGEHNIALVLQWMKERCRIKDWAFEQTTFRFKGPGVKSYLMDFDILNRDGTLEYWEYKGHIQNKDVQKFRKVAECAPQVRIRLVMAGKRKRDANLLRQAQKYVEEIVYADDLLKPLKEMITFA